MCGNRRRHVDVWVGGAVVVCAGKRGWSCGGRSIEVVKVKWLMQVIGDPHCNMSQGN